MLAGMLFANVAGAVGVDFTVNGCPGSAGTSQQQAMECAAGTAADLVITFQPAEDVADMVAADWILDITTQGDVGSTANFWDVQALNPTAFSVQRTIPVASCLGYYLNFWNVTDAGGAWAAAVRNPHTVRIAGLVYRPSGVAVRANQKIFAAIMRLDVGASVEAGGSLVGCCASGTSLLMKQLIPSSASGSTTTILTGGSLTFGPVSVDPSGGCTGPVESHRKSWGALKSLYR